MMKFKLTLILSVISFFSVAQPSITNIDPDNTYAGGEVIISGSGFGTNAADVIVWFGGIKSPNIISINNTSITAEVPAGAPNSSVFVQRVSSGLMSQSEEHFYIRHYGSTFDINEFDAGLKFADNSVEKLDLCGCDFDGDGKVDFAASQSSGTNVTLMRNTSTTGNISFVITQLNVITPTISIKCGDLDGDGKPDLFMSRSGANNNQLYLYRNTSASVGTISFGSQIIINLLTTDPTNRPYQAIRLASGDLTGDGKLDLVVTNGLSTEPLLNIIVNQSTIGNISFGTPQIIDFNNQNTNSGIDLEDMDGDGNLDMVLTRNQSSDVYVYRNLGGGSLDFATPLVLSTNSQALVNVNAYDLDNDGKKEIVATETFSKGVLIYKNNSTPGNLTFNSPSRTVVGLDPGGSTNPEPSISEAGDFNGDGLVDLVVSNRAESSYNILINQGGLNFGLNSRAIDYATRNIYAGDIDGDGKPDVIFSSLQIPTGNFAIQVVRNGNCFQPVFLNEQPLAICATQTLTLETPESPGTTYSWKKDGGDMGLNTASIDITTFGNYEVTAVSEGGACTTSAILSVADGSGTIPTDPVANNDGPACSGETINLSVDTQSGATYSWTGPNSFTSTAQNPVLSNITVDDAGLYEVTVKIGDCLSSSASTEVVVNAVPSFSLSATSGATTVCQGSTVTLETQNRSGYTYQWLKDGGTVSGSSNTFVANSTGTYQASITETSTGCIIFSNEVDVTVLSAPTSAFTFNTPICSGIDAIFTNTSTVDAGASVVYTWDFGDGTSINATDASHVFTSANDYDVKLDISYTGITGCTSTVTNTVTVVDATPVNIQASSSAICEGETIDLSVDNSFGSIDWSTGETSSIITIDAAGTYNVTTIDANNCQSTDNITITAGTVPTVLAFANQTQGSITVISGTQVQMLATGADSYLWEPSDFLSDPEIADPISTPNAEITYTVSGAVTGGCIGTATITILVEQGVEEIDVEPISAFNPDNSNDPTWRIIRSENYPECTLSIFDERGSLIFREIGYANDWDGTYKGNKLPEGVYYFVFSCPAVKPYTGTVLLVR